MAYKVVYTVKDFVDLLLEVATKLPTKYWAKYPYNLGYYHAAGYWTFDCWNLVKAIIWGWKANKTVGYYAKRDSSTGLGDWTGAQIISKCSEVSSDFSKVPVGAFLLTTDNGHAGVFVGELTYEGEIYNTVECTTSWSANKVILSYTDERGRRYKSKGKRLQSIAWSRHGKLPWIDYSVSVKPEPVPTPEPTPAPAPVQDEDIYYVVQRGDNLSRIANKYSTTVAELVKLNKIANPNLIYVGQKLLIRKGSSSAPAPAPVKEKVYYTVKRGDNLSKIAAKYGTTVNQLVGWNNIKNPNLIYVGQKLRVK